ncbi:MAG: hypothetical protein ACI9MX_003462 [Candidatus Aldehydirespiratoraceae bacterium]|jgi:hypothetical protein
MRKWSGSLAASVVVLALVAAACGDEPADTTTNGVERRVGDRTQPMLPSPGGSTTQDGTVAAPDDSTDQDAARSTPTNDGTPSPLPNDDLAPTTTGGPGSVASTTVPGTPASTTVPGSDPTTTSPNAPSTTIAPTSPNATTTVPATTATNPPTTTAPAGPSCCGEGELGIYVMAKTAFNPWSGGGHWPWMNANYESAVVWEPYWDSRLAEFDDVTVYRDAYAIKVDTNKDTRSVDQPDWLLRDAGGNPAYIPFGCSSGCPQFAADIGNQAFRDHWMGEVQGYINKGYHGLYIDDVNYLWRFGDANGGDIEPIDPRTGQVLTLANWQLYMTEFLEQVRAAFPQIEIWHNAIWYADSPSFGNSLVDRQIRAADFIQLERGMNDPGLKTGTSKYGMQTFMAFIDRIHANGTNVGLLDEHATNSQGQWYNIAGGLLINNGGDLVTTEDWPLISPTGLFAGYLTDLGHSLGPRQVVGGTIQREFTGGLVVMNEPRSDAVTVDLGGSWIDPNGATITSITLATAEAVVLTRP